MLTTIKGYYDNGHIVMMEEPPVNDKTDVIITFLSEEKIKDEQKKSSWGF